MTPAEKLLVLKLFGLECGKCKGKGGYIDVFVFTDCPACSGTGYLLSEATRESWPKDWWHCYACHHFEFDADEPCTHKVGDDMGPKAFLPHFPTDPAASVRLAEEMRAVVDFSTNAVCFRAWHIRQGESLGQSLLDVLAACCRDAEAADG